MEVWNNRLLVAQGDWPDVGKTAESVRKLLIKRLVEENAVPVERNISYWKAVGVKTIPAASVLYIQHSPVWLFRGLIHTFNIKNNLKSPSLEFWKCIYPKLSAFRDRASKSEIPKVSTGIASSKSIESTQKPSNVVIASFRYVRSQIISAALYVVVQFRNLRNSYISLADRLASDKIKQLTQEQNQIAKMIGDLLIASENIDLSKESDVKELVFRMASAFTNEHSIESIKTSEDALQILQELLQISAIGKNSTQTSTSSLDGSICAVSTSPCFWIRYWPLMALLVIGGWKITGSWADLVKWFDINVVSTGQMFWQNWVIQPLLQVYRTIRHDDNMQVALIAKESLSSDISSLERMVVDFAKDTNPQLTSDELASIRLAASRGNVTPVMSVYEQQISSPITNAITGKLIRTVLIQVQKSKVDLEVALSGIDQILQSQQLVFGLVAAFPALLTIFWLVRLSSSGIWSSAVRKGQVRRPIIADMLLTLDKTIQTAPTKLESKDIGLIYSCIYLIRAEFEGHHSISQSRLLEQLDRLESNAIETRDAQRALSDLDRAYNRYYMPK